MTFTTDCVSESLYKSYVGGPSYGSVITFLKYIQVFTYFRLKIVWQVEHTWHKFGWNPLRKFDKQVNVQKVWKTFWGSCQLQQADEKVCNEMKGIENKEKMKRIKMFVMEGSNL